MNFFYSAGAMSYGNGWFWHKSFNFPKFPIVTKTITLNRKIGYPFAVVRMGNTIYNHIGLHNFGVYKFLMFAKSELNNSVIISIAGTDDEIEEMIAIISQERSEKIIGIELNFSCPNVKNVQNRAIPRCDFPLTLKLNHKQDPYDYDLSRIKSIRVNTVPCRFGGLSGEKAQAYNWRFIKKFNHDGLNIAGCSFLSKKDIRYLREYCGCTEFGVGSLMLINPKLVETLSLI